MTPEAAPTPDEKPLWQLGLDWLCDSRGGSTHWLDLDRAYRLAQGMHAVGERPVPGDVRRYIRNRWGEPWRESGEMVWKAWKAVNRKPYRRLSGRRWQDGYLYEVDWLIEQYRLEPVTEDRLAAATEEALCGFLSAARDGDRIKYVEARKALDSTLGAVNELRSLRLGEDVTGPSPRSNPRRPRRPKWW